MGKQRFVHKFSRPLQRALRRNAVTGTLYALASLRFGRKSWLRQVGWWESFRARAALDRNWRPVPWYTYPAIAFLDGRAGREWEIFEYGSGSSTLWWATRVASVTACESDEDWFRKVDAEKPDNVTLLLRGLGEGGYARTLAGYPGRFDVIVIDGFERNECAALALQALKPGGVVVWDNSDRERYAPGMDLLASQGFRRIDFSGPGPGAVRGWMTSVFYRPGNCLGL